jgi:hypothetical protein
MNVGVLQPSQSLGMRPTQFTDSESADFLVHSLAAERISRKVIRLFSSESAFRRLVPAQRTYIPAKLPAIEVEGTRFAHMSMRRKMARICTDIGTVYIPAAHTRSHCANYFAGL